ncbi:MAG: nucleotidyltransferase family protein [Saprospirales bacterium]|nr:nucleotidyltransferase family protein [Saprospirales bacterium]
MITAQQVSIIKNILSPFRPEYIGFFGSFARDEQHPASDLDILVRFGKRLTLFDLVGLEQELSESLGIKVDLVTENALSPQIKQFVERDIRQIA